MRAETLSSPVATGSGRYVDWMWPPAYGAIASLAQVGLSRMGVAASISYTGAGGGALVVGSSAGVDHLSLTTAAGGDTYGIGFGALPGTHMHLRTSGLALAAPLAAVGEWTNVYRYIASLAGNGVAVASATSPFGLAVAHVNGSTVINTAFTGWEITIATATIARLSVRGPNGLVAFDLTAAPFDTTLFHSYELRFFAATVTNVARVECWIDGAKIALPALTATYAAGTNNPPSVASGGYVGFAPSLFNAAGNANTLKIAGFRMVAGADIKSVL